MSDLKMRKLQFLVLFICAIIIFAQSQNRTEKDSLYSELNTKIKFTALESSLEPIFKTPYLLKTNRLYQNEFYGFALQKSTFKISSINTNFSPPPNLYDNLHNQYFFSNNSWLNTFRTSSNYYVIGGLYIVGASYNQKIADFGILSGGVYAAKFNIYNNFYNSAGVNGNLKLILNDRVSLNFFGQYTPMTNTSMMQLMSSMYPQSNYGGSFEFKVTDKWGVMVGTEREFDVISRKWVINPFIIPVFYK